MRVSYTPAEWNLHLTKLLEEYFYGPLEAYAKEDRTSVIDESFQVSIKFLSSAYSFRLVGRREASYWVLVLELKQGLFTPSDASDFPILVTSESLEGAFQLLNEALSDKMTGR